MRHLRAVRCDVFVQVPSPKRHSKLSVRAEKGLMVGYELHGGGYRIWSLGSRRVEESRDCVFVETSSTEGPDERSLDDATPRDHAVTARNRGRLRKDATAVQSETPRRHGMTIRPGARNIANSPRSNIVTGVDVDPSCYHDAINFTESSQWLEAMTEEMQSFEEHGFWKLVPPSNGVTPVKCKWVFKKKISGET